MRIRPGDCVVSVPDCADPRFKQSVIMICQHTTDGTFGVMLNKHTDLSVNDVMLEHDDALNIPLPLYVGGPVAPQSMWMLHSAEWSMNNTQFVTEYLSYTSHAGMFAHIADGDSPNEMRLFLGYTGWAPGQLMGEIRGQAPWTRSHTWLVWQKPDPEIIWDTPEDRLWSKACKQVGAQAVAEWLD